MTLACLAKTILENDWVRYLVFAFLIKCCFFYLGEFGEYFEGDMLLTAVQREAIQKAMDVDGTSRNGLRNGAKRWPNKTVVYHINDEDFG